MESDGTIWNPRAYVRLCVGGGDQFYLDITLCE